jgi:anti-sigma regulatory factor (Ser/Thr protein kinase)
MIFRHDSEGAQRLLPWRRPHHSGAAARARPVLRGDVVRLAFDCAALGRLRGLVRSFALAQGIGHARAHDLVLAVCEIATNSVVHGGGAGVLRMWREGGAVVCEVRDAGRGIGDQRAGHRRPDPDDPGGRGLWLAHQLADRVEARVACGHGVVRVQMRVAQARARASSSARASSAVAAGSA